MKKKVLSLQEASMLVENGCSLGIGGTSLCRKPMAFVSAIIKRGAKDLDISTFLSGMDADLLIGAGCIRTLSSCYVGFEGLGAAPNFTKKAVSGEIIAKEYSEYMLVYGLRAARMGLTFIPTKAGLGSQLIETLDLKTIECPYTGQIFLAIPAISPDVAVIHAQRSDRYGNIQNPLKKDFSIDTDYVLLRAAKKRIVTVEEIVSRDMIREENERTVIFDFEVDAIVEVPNGAAPTSFLPEYDADLEEINTYLKMSRTSEGFKEYLEKFVYNEEGKG